MNADIRTKAACGKCVGCENESRCTAPLDWIDRVLIEVQERIAKGERPNRVYIAPEDAGPGPAATNVTVQASPRTTGSTRPRAPRSIRQRDGAVDLLPKATPQMTDPQHLLRDTAWTAGPWTAHKTHTPISGGAFADYTITGPGRAVCIDRLRHADAQLMALSPEMAEAILACVAGWKASDGETCGPDGDERMHAVAEKLLAMGATLPTVEWEDGHGF